MRRVTQAIPNLLSGTRLLLVPILWILALQGETTAMGFGLLVAGLTDALDGFLARRLHAVTPAGAALDSLADNLLMLSVAAWLVLLRPDVVAHFASWFFAVVALHVAFLVIGMIRFHRFGNLHLYSAKVAGVTGFAFIVACFLWPGIPVVLGVIAFSSVTVAVVEGNLCLILCRHVDESIGSLPRALRRERNGSSGPSIEPGRVA